MILFGTIVNVGTIIAGSLLGFFFHSRLPQRIVKIIFQAIGLFTIYIGITMTMKTGQILVLIFSMVIGSALGEWIDLEKYINRFSEWIKLKLKSENETFSEGMITAFLLFCIGSMTILGAFEDGWFQLTGFGIGTGHWCTFFHYSIVYFSGRFNPAGHMAGQPHARGSSE